MKIGARSNAFVIPPPNSRTNCCNCFSDKCVSIIKKKKNSTVCSERHSVAFVFYCDGKKQSSRRSARLRSKRVYASLAETAERAPRLFCSVFQEIARVLTQFSRQQTNPTGSRRYCFVRCCN